MIPSSYYRQEADLYATTSMVLERQGRKRSANIAIAISFDLDRVADLVDSLGQANDMYFRPEEKR